MLVKLLIATYPEHLARFNFQDLQGFRSLPWLILAKQFKLIDYLCDVPLYSISGFSQS
jgi:hypothetical protein